jgi:glutamine amidotransferase
MIALIDYQAGNVRSVLNALDRLGVSAKLTADPDEIRRAEKIIFPGQGSAQQGMATLEKAGLVDVLRESKVPFLGICLGMQLLFDWSEEGEVDMLGIIPGKVCRFPRGDLPVPQMGWNVLKSSGDCPLLRGIPDESRFYFVHSYAAAVGEETLGVSFYGGLFSALVQKDNFYGAQFHPEKSGELGVQLLRNFLKL